MEQNSDFKQAMSKLRGILGKDFEDIIYEDIKQHHPNVLSMVKASVTEEVSKEQFDNVVKENLYQDFTEYYPKAFLMFVGRLERHVIEAFTDELKKQFSNDAKMSQEDLGREYYRVLEYDLDVINCAISNYEPIAMEEKDKPEV